MRTSWTRACVRVLLAACALMSSAGSAGVLAQLRTVYGDIEIELFERDKPATVANFIRYVESGRWNNMFAHRLVPGFVLQGGGYGVPARGTTNADFASVPRFPDVPNEFAVGRRLSNVYGTVAMAKLGGDTNSANAEWFVNLANNTFLDAENTNNLFTVFGQVVRGTNVLNTLNRFVYWTPTNRRPTNVVANIGGPFDELPLVTTNATFADLVYVDVTLLGVEVAYTAQGAEVSWTSVAGRTNRVEFTASMPPAWEVLLRTNGSGGRIVAQDPTSASGSRFYRVRVEY